LRKADRSRIGDDTEAGAVAAVPLALIERDNASLQQRIAAFEQTLSRLRDNNADLLRRSADATGHRIREVERVLARTGIDPDRLIGRFGRGGPFLPSGRQGPEARLAVSSDI